MIAFRKFKEGTTFVSFPTNSYGSPVISEEINHWIAQHSPHITWATVNGKRVGILLSDEDAVAFRLRWM